MDDVENFDQAFAGGIGLGPPGQGFGHLVDQQHAAVPVRGDDRVADAAQGHDQALVLGRGSLQVLQALKPFGQHFGQLLHEGDVL